jgi:hypothetical protein
MLPVEKLAGALPDVRGHERRSNTQKLTPSFGLFDLRQAEERCIVGVARAAADLDHG